MFLNHHHHQPLLNIGLPNRTPSDRSILGYSHPAAPGHFTKIVVPPSLRAFYLTFADSRSPLENTSTSVIVPRLIWPAHCFLTVWGNVAMGPECPPRFSRVFKYLKDSCFFFSITKINSAQRELHGHYYNDD